MTKEEREVFTKRLSKIVKLIDKVGNTYTFKVCNEFMDGDNYIYISDDMVKEKLILCHMKPNLQYITINYETWGDELHYKTINYVLSDNSYSVGSNTLKSDDYEDTCNIVAGLYRYF